MKLLKRLYIQKTTEKICADVMGVMTWTKKKLPWFLVGFGIHPTWYVFLFLATAIGLELHNSFGK